MQRDVLTNKMRKTLNKLNEKKFEKRTKVDTTSDHFFLKQLPVLT